MKNDILQKDLIKILGDRYASNESTRLNYSRGEDIYEPVLSQAVVFPNTNEEVSKIVKLCTGPFKVAGSQSSGEAPPNRPGKPCHISLNRPRCIYWEGTNQKSLTILRVQKNKSSYTKNP